MALLHEDKDRKVIPRWRGFFKTLKVGELVPTTILTEPIPISNRSLIERKKEWEENKSFSFAADFVATAVAMGEAHEAKDAAEFIIGSKGIKQHTIIQLANRILVGHVLKDTDESIVNPEELQNETRRGIHAIRIKLHDEPRNAFLWMNLSRLYAILGLPNQATHAAEMANMLAPDDRFVLRSSARLFVHLGEYRRGHDILRRCERVSYDPWLLAAEIAVAGARGKTSKFIKRAKVIIEDRQFSPFHISELAIALSTVSFEGDKAKHGRKYLNDALVHPTENTIAQAAWLSRRFFEAGLPSMQANWPTSHEARAWNLSQNAKWKECVDEAIEWLEDQPFSSRPPTHGSYIAAVAMGDYDLSAKLASLGLIANPDDFTLINNYAFALGHLGRIKEARESFSRIRVSSLSNEEQFVWMATNGFLCYREGNPSEGKRQYLQALEKANQVSDPKRRLSALIWFTHEELRSESQDAGKYKEEVIKSTMNLPYPELLPLVDSIKKSKK